MVRFAAGFGPAAKRIQPERISATSRLQEMADGISEQPQPVAFRLQPQAGPARVLRRQDVAFRVRHQAEYPAARVTDAGHVALRAVRVDGVWAGPAVRAHV